MLQTKHFLQATKTASKFRVRHPTLWRTHPPPPPPCKRDNIDKVFFVQIFRKKNFYQVFDENFARVYVVYASVLSNNKVVSLIRDEVYSNTTVCINVRQLFVAYRWFSLAFRWKWRYTPTTNKLDKYSEI